MNQNKIKESWEERLDNLFDFSDFSGNIGSPVYYLKDCKSNEDMTNLKVFITSLLQARNREIIEKIEGKKIADGEVYGVPTVVPDGGKIAQLQDSAMVIAHNQALSDIITTLTREDNK